MTSITGPVSTRLINSPATPGPTTRATLKYTALNAEALGTSSGPTSSLTKDILAGTSTALTVPRPSANR